RGRPGRRRQAGRRGGRRCRPFLGLKLGLLQPGRALPGGAAAFRSGGPRRPAGGREPDRRALPLGRRVPAGAGRSPVRLPPADPGFDCSGLTAWSWGQVGVSLPHFSGAQMSDSAPVPVSDLQPGDLLFYGPGGSDHVAMYVGPGEMIEAPFTGASVWITSLRL